MSEIKLPDGTPADQIDYTTQWFIGFPQNLQGDALNTQQKLQSTIATCWAFFASKAEGTVQQKIRDGMIPSNDSQKIATFRSKVFDYLCRNMASWIQREHEETVEKRIQTSRGDFHQTILRTVLGGLPVPTGAYAQLETVLKSIKNSIVKAGQDKASSLVFWVSFTTYRYEEIIQRTNASIRTVVFKPSHRTYEAVVPDKSTPGNVDFDLTYVVFDGSFNNKLFESVAPSIPQEYKEKGAKMIKNAVLDIQV